MRSRSYLGTGFEVWNGQRTWFWFVGNPHRDGGMVGAASTETEAVREARASIEEMSAQRRAPAATPHVTSKDASMRAFQQSNSITSAMIVWEHSLKNLERYLSSVRGARPCAT